MSKSIIEAEKAAVHGIIHLAAIGVAKLFTGIFTGMTVLIADAVNSFADTLGVFGSYLGLRLSRKSADQHFKYGYYKVETFVALLISVGITYIGYLLAVRSVQIFMEPTVGKNRVFAITIAIIGIISSYRLYKRFKKAGEKCNAISMIAVAQEKKMDILSGTAVLISVVANYREIPYVEGLVTGVISILILKVGIFTAKESLFYLLDYWDDPKLSRKISKILRKDKKLIKDIKKLKIRRAGTFIFGEAFVEINPFAGMQDLREQLNFLRSKVKKADPYIKDFVIYTHIPEAKKFKIAIPVKEEKKLKSKVASTLPSTKGYLIAEVEGNNIKKSKIKKLTESKKKPVALSKFLKDEEVNVVIDNRLSSLVYYNLRRTHHILIYPNFADVKTAEDALKLFLIDD